MPSNARTRSEQRSRSANLLPMQRAALYVVAAACAAAGIYRVVRLDGPPDRDVLFFFLAAVVVLLADTIRKFKFGDLEFELQQLEERVEELADVSRAQTAPQLPVGLELPAPHGKVDARTTGQSVENIAARLADEIYQPPLTWEADPVARTGAPAAKNGHKLTAVVLPSSNYDDMFRIVVNLLVAGSAVLPDNARAAFFLHHTFPSRVRFAPIEHRYASQSLISRGSFTVGALVPDESATFLSLNLAEDSPDCDVTALSPKQRHTFRTS